MPSPDPLPAPVSVYETNIKVVLASRNEHALKPDWPRCHETEMNKSAKD
jgi:hypothetical protein